VALARIVHHDQRIFPKVLFSPSDLEELLYAGLLHDVGKIGIREEVLTKATRLPVAHLDVIAQRLALRAWPPVKIPRPTWRSCAASTRPTRSAARTRP